MRDNAMTWERYQELQTDCLTAKRLSVESGEPYDTFLTAYIQKRWTRDEIRFYAADYLEQTRRDENDGWKEWLRSYWQGWLDRLADEDVRNAAIKAYAKVQSANAKAMNRAKNRPK